MERLDLSSISDQERARLFLNHLDGFFLEFRKQSFGSSYFYEDSFVNETNISGTIDGKNENFFIRIVSDLNGNLKYLEFDDNKHGEYKEKINNLIIDSLMKSLDDKKKTFYRRYHYTYIGPQLEGEYWIKGARIAPIHDDEDNKVWDNVERYFSIELSVSAIDEPDADAKGNVASDIIAARLSMLLDVGISQPIVEHKWCIDVNNREDRFRNELFMFFQNNRIVKVPRGINISFNGIHTDLDAVAYDTKTKTLGLFQLKWQDRYHHSMKERYSRISNLFDKSNEWIGKIKYWVENNSDKSIISSLQINNQHKSSTEIDEVYIFVISRNQMNFTGVELDSSVAWSSWHQLIESQANIGSNINNPIREMFVKIKALEPQNRIQRGEKPQQTKLVVELGDYKIYNC